MHVVVVSRNQQLVEVVESLLTSDVPCEVQSFDKFVHSHRCANRDELSIIDAGDISENELVVLVRSCCASDCALLVIIRNSNIIKMLRDASSRCRGLFDVLLWTDLPIMLDWKLRGYQRIMRNDQRFRDAKEAEARLRYREEALQELADSMPLLIWRADDQGRLDYYNKRWYKYTGTPRDSGEFGKWPDAIHPDDLERVKSTWFELLKTGRDYMIEYRIREASSGNYYWHLVLAVPTRDATGKIKKWFGSSVNIDPLKRSAQEVERLVEQLDNANRLKDEFLATLSHELRTPLNVVLGHAELLSDGSELKEEERLHSLTTIVRNAGMLSRLVDDILDVSKIITGKLSVHVDSTNIQEVVEAVVEGLQVTWKAKGLHVHTQSSEVPTLIADEDRIRQVIWNLLTNAIKFTPTGGEIEVNVRKEDNQAVIEVKDSGLGIERDFLPRVFDRFSQQDGSAARKYGGLGLGLAIVRHIIELHGGSVEAESGGVGKGATFRVRLPIVPAVPYDESSQSQ